MVAWDGIPPRDEGPCYRVRSSARKEAENLRVMDSDQGPSEAEEWCEEKAVGSSAKRDGDC